LTALPCISKPNVCKVPASRVCRFLSNSSAQLLKTTPHEKKNYARIAFTRNVRSIMKNYCLFRNSLTAEFSIEAAENDSLNLANIWFGKL
jgi:hypothetical protein